MSGIKYAAAMLAAGTAGGAASAVHAYTTVTLDLPPSATTTEYITLTGSGVSWSTTASAAAQYAFGPKTTFSDATLYASPTGLEGDFDAGWPTSSTSFSSTSAYPADFFGEVVVKGPTDLQVEFTAGGQSYWGLANFAENGELETFTFTAVPEPEAWALLIAGLGVAGGVIRGSRRRRQAISA